MDHVFTLHWLGKLETEMLQQNHLQSFWTTLNQAK